MIIVAKRKYRNPPSMPHWFWLDMDNCWFCKNRNDCSNCSVIKKSRKKYLDIKEGIRYMKMIKDEVNTFEHGKNLEKKI